MNARQRFRSVIDGTVPDRVPVTLFICDGGHFLNQAYPEIDSWDHETLQLKVIELQKQFGVDVFYDDLDALTDAITRRDEALQRIGVKDAAGGSHRVAICAIRSHVRYCF